MNKIPNDSYMKLLLHTTLRFVVVINDLNRYAVEKIMRINVLGRRNFMDKLITPCCTK